MDQAVQIKDHAVIHSIYSRIEFFDPDNRVARAARGYSLRIGRRRFIIKRGLALEDLRKRFADRLGRDEAWEGNLTLNEGINELYTILCSAGGTKFDNTNARIGVGDSSTAADATQTGLQATTNKLYKAMDSGWPTFGSAQKATWRSTFASGDANFTWNEITVANGNSDAAKNLNRKVQSMGPKTSDYTWIASLEHSLA